MTGSALTLGTIGATAGVQAQPCPNADLVVDNGGSGDYTTIQAAVDAAPAGATICVEPGVYPETVNIGKPLTLVGDPGSSSTVGLGSAAPVLEGNHRNATAISLYASDTGGVVHATDVTVKGFVVQNWGSGVGPGAGVAGGHNRNITVRNCRFFDVVNGIVNNNPGGPGRRGWRVSRNVFENVSNHGVLLQNTDDVQIDHNVVRGGEASIDGLDYTFQPIKVSASVRDGLSGSCKGIRISGNRLTGKFEGAVQRDGGRVHGSGIYFLAINGNDPNDGTEAVIADAEVTDNVIESHHASDTGRLFFGYRVSANPGAGATVDIHDVSVDGNRAVGPQVAYHTDTAHDTGVSNVTFSGNRASESRSGFNLGTSGNGRIADVTYENNIASGCHVGLSPNAVGVLDGLTVVGNEFRRNDIGARLLSDGTGVFEHVEVRGNTVAGNSETGLSVNNLSSPSATSIHVEENELADNERGFTLVNSEATGILLTFNNIRDNRQFGAGNVGSGGSTLTAQCNYWGHASGPTHPANRAGRGDRIIGDVDYDPWIPRPFEDVPEEACHVTTGHH